MKRILLIGSFSAITLVAACGGSPDSVSRNQAAPLDLSIPGEVKKDPSGSFSARSSLDLLSFS